ncbi:MAG: glycoside hydrolase family 9 protein [Lewinellaceae bacterium]|nr:glycoside hydrolase family 9 protein [Lewinellaceae bacterium]
MGRTGHQPGSANCGILNLDFADYNINPAQSTEYQNVAEQYLHWFHGESYGNGHADQYVCFRGDFCANEMYHTWFNHWSDWDNALFSSKGPAPGYIVGGPNANYSYSQLSPPANQPPQKAYRDFNDGWPESSWEITEPAIYYQAA